MTAPAAITVPVAPVVPAIACIGVRRGRGGGTMARQGRAALWVDLTAPPPSSGTPDCDCTKCQQRHRAFTPAEAETVLRHVTNWDAVAYAAGRLTVVSFIECGSCGGWVPMFTDSDLDD